MQVARAPSMWAENERRRGFIFGANQFMRLRSSTGIEWMVQFLMHFGGPIEEGLIKVEEEKKLITIVMKKEGGTDWPISIKESVERDETGQIKLSDIILKLKKQNFYDFFDSSVSYYHSQKELFVFCFFLSKTVTDKELLKDRKYQKTIPIEALEEKKSELQLILRFRKKCKSKLELLKEEQDERYANEEQVRKGSKQKEKTIAEVIEKVALWRKLYIGFNDEKGENVHYELEDAASKIGVIKKTLDDYLLQIRNGKRYGFNFHKRKSDKIGELRSFVKEKRNKK